MLPESLTLGQRNLEDVFLELTTARRPELRRPPREHLRPRPRRRALRPPGADPGLDGGPADAAQRRAAAAGRGHPGDRAGRRRARRRAGRPRPTASTPSRPACSPSRSCRRRSPRWPSRPASSAATASSSASAPRPCRAPGCCAARCSRCSPSRCCRSLVIGGVAPRARLGPVGSRRRRRCSPSCSAPPPSPRSGLFVAGSLRAEATLAAANLVYLLLMAGGAVVLPASAYGSFGDVVTWLPSGALGEAMRAAPRRRRRRRPRPARARRLDRRRRRPDREDLHVGMSARRATCARSAGPRLVANIGIVVTGGAVRLTGSGLGCPTWPRCTDESFRAARRARPPRGDRVRQPDADLRADRRGGRDVRGRLADRTPLAAPARAGARARRTRPGGASAASPCSPTSTRGSSRCTCCCRWRWSASRCCSCAALDDADDAPVGWRGAGAGPGLG